LAPFVIEWAFLDTIRTTSGLSKALVKLDLGQVEASKEWEGRGKFAVPNPVYRKSRRLASGEVDLLIAGYQGGKTVSMLPPTRIPRIAVMAGKGTPHRWMPTLWAAGTPVAWGEQVYNEAVRMVSCGGVSTERTSCNHHCSNCAYEDGDPRRKQREGIDQQVRHLASVLFGPVPQASALIQPFASEVTAT